MPRPASHWSLRRSQGSKAVSLARIDLAAASAIGIFAANQALAPLGLRCQRRQHPGRGTGHVDLRGLGAAGRHRRRARRPQRPRRHELHHRPEAVEPERPDLGDDDRLRRRGQGARRRRERDLRHGASSTTRRPTRPGSWSTKAAMEAAGFKDITGFRSNAYSAVQVVAEVLTGLPDKTAPALYAKLPTVTGLKVDLLPPLQFTTPPAAIPAGVQRVRLLPAARRRRLQDAERRASSTCSRASPARASLHMDVVRFALLG